MHLGNDGCRGNGETQCIGVCYRLLPNLHLWQGKVVYQKVLRSNLQTSERQAHCLAGCGNNPLSIDLLCSNDPYAHRPGPLLDNVEKLLSPTGREELGITYTLQFLGERWINRLVPGKGQNDPSGNHRPGPCTPASLIQARDVQASLGEKPTFQGQSRPLRRSGSALQKRFSRRRAFLPRRWRRK